MHQSTQAVSSTTFQAVTGTTRTKAASAPASLFSSGSSTSVANSGSSKARALKRTRSGSHVFEKSPVPASNKVPESRSLELLGKGKLGTEVLARVSHSLNERAISGFANSQKSANKRCLSINNKQRTQLPLQSRLNMVNRCRDPPLEHFTIDSTSNCNPDVESTLKSSRGPMVVAKPPTSLKDSPRKGRLKALLQEIGREKTSFTSDHSHKKELPTQNAALSQNGFERPRERESAERGQSSGRVSQITIASRDSAEFSRPLSQKVSYDVQPNIKLVEPRRKSISSPAPSAQPKRSYRTENQTTKAGSMLLCLTDDDEKLGLEEPDQPTIETTTQESLDDDAAYNDANSSSSYGDLDIDASLLEEVCKEYDT